ncbi:MAG: hypothetical protein JO165_12250, partial [Candidatus Eremiobacteraeota bacterium]|nr:hypothetical protein [Candidatus Eremiobacteraeota bacterium]
MRYRLGILAAVVLAAALLAGFGRTLIPFALAQGIGFATQTKISFATAAYTARQMNLTNVHVHSRSGEPIAEIAHVSVRYNLRDVLPGSRRRFGLENIDVDRPIVTIVRHRDGSYNLPIPSNGNAPPQNAPQAAPFDFTAHLRNGSVSVLDEARSDPRRRYLYLEALSGDARFNTAHRSWYSVRLVYREGAQRYPVRGIARIDADDGAMMHHWSAAKIPLPQILEYVINSPAISVQSGTLENLDARYFGVANSDGDIAGRLTARAALNGMRLAISGIARPIRDLHGDLTVTQHGLLASRLNAQIAGVPVAIGGGIINLSNPQLRVTARGAGDASAIASLIGKRLPQPVKGLIAFQLRVEGPPERPLSLVAFGANRVQYGGLPFDAPSGVAAIGTKDAHIFAFATRYAGIAVSGRGRVAFDQEPGAIQIVARASAISTDVPYAGMLVSRMPLGATILATADDPKHVQTEGLLAGQSGPQQVVAAFHVNSAGVGNVYPIEVSRGSRSLFGSISLDHPNGNIDAVVSARDFSLLPARTVTLPGLHVPALPAVRAAMNGQMYAAQRNGGVALLGAMQTRDVRINGLDVPQARIAFRYDAAGRSVTEVRAAGPWGTLDARGAVASTSAIAMRGTYAGSLASLSALGIPVPG